jgi:hypothetical protein
MGHSGPLPPWRLGPPPPSPASAPAQPQPSAEARARWTEESVRRSTVCVSFTRRPAGEPTTEPGSKSPASVGVHESRHPVASAVAGTSARPGTKPHWASPVSSWHLTHLPSSRRAPGNGPRTVDVLVHPSSGPLAVRPYDPSVVSTVSSSLMRCSTSSRYSLADSASSLRKASSYSFVGKAPHKGPHQ